jgi:hypothetical protein
VTVYIGGNFHTAGGQPREYIAAIDGDTGAATGWNPGADDIVRQMIRTGGGLTTPVTIYAAGEFRFIGGQPRNFLAAIDQSGAATGWNPNPNQPVTSIAAGGGLIYASGLFDLIGGQPRLRLAAIDAAGAATGWDPGADGAAWALQVFGSSLFTGGSFTTVGGPIRNNLAALDALTGQPTGWNPGAGGPVHALAVHDATVYVGGEFAVAGNALRNNAAAIDILSGAARPWDPNANGAVRALAVQPLSLGRALVYMGGEFTSVSGQIRNHLAAMEDAVFPLLTDWDPNVDNTVRALAVDGSRVYAGGFFANLPSMGADRLTAFRLDGSWDSDFQASANGAVHAIVVDGDRLYVGGFFSDIGGRDRQHLAVLDRYGSANTWDPFTDGTVDALALDGQVLYVGGQFNYLGGLPRPGLAALDVTYGLVVPDFQPVGFGDVRALAAGAGRLYAGGLLWYEGDVTRARFAAFGSDIVAGIGATAAHPRVGDLRFSSNPFHDWLELQFELPHVGLAQVGVFDARGRLVRRMSLGVLPVGEHRAVWDGRDAGERAVAAGTYFLRVTAGEADLRAKVLRLN